MAEAKSDTLRARLTQVQTTLQRVQKDGERMVAKIAVLKDISKWRATDETTRILERLIHDVRTHLTTIVGFTGLLAQGSAGDLNDEQRREFLLVRDAADRVLHLVAGLQAMLTTPGGGSRKAP